MSLSEPAERVLTRRRGRMAKWWLLGATVLLGVPLALLLGSYAETYDPHEDARAFLRSYEEHNREATSKYHERAILGRKGYLSDEAERLRLALPKSHGWEVSGRTSYSHDVSATAHGTTRLGKWIRRFPALSALSPQPSGQIQIRLTPFRWAPTMAEYRRLETVPYGHPDGWTLAEVIVWDRPYDFKMKPQNIRDFRVPTPSAPGRRPGQ